MKFDEFVTPDGNFLEDIETLTEISKLEEFFFATGNSTLHQNSTSPAHHHWLMMQHENLVLLAQTLLATLVIATELA